MIKRLMVDKMTCMKILLMLINTIICMSAVLMIIICQCILERDLCLRGYRNMSVQGSGVADFGAVLLDLATVVYMISFTSIVVGILIARSRPVQLYLYGVFLAFVALFNFVLLGAGALVVYRTNLYFDHGLNEGFDQGLNESNAAYGQNNSKSSHINTVRTVLQRTCYDNHTCTDWVNYDQPKNIPLYLCQDTFLKQICKGCHNLMLDFMNGKFGLVAGTVIGTTLCLLIGSFLSCCLASNINKVKQGVRCKGTDLHTKDHICLIHIWNKTVCAVPKSGKVTDEVRQKELLCP